MTKQTHNSQTELLGLWRYALLSFFLIATWFSNQNAAIAAPFNSGSTGADGAFAPTENVSLTVPPSGIFNFTTVTIPVGITVTFTPNATNTPVTILASGDVTIAGTIDLSGADGASGDSISVALGGTGGPGGFRGGNGGIAPPFNGGSVKFWGPGLGPGVNQCEGQPAAFGTSPSPQTGCFGLTSPRYGTVTLLPLIGGSGGTGGGANSGSALTCTNGCNGGGGGGGGGAILIASSGTITLNGNMFAKGGNGGNGNFPGGPASGGGIRLVANTVTGNGTISVVGGGPNRLGRSAGAGRVRIEANTLSFSGTINPTNGAITASTPGLVNFSPVPTLSVTSVGGVSVPSAPNASFTSPDITLPSSTTNPVTVNLAAFNIPIGTVIKLVVTGRDGGSQSDYNSTPLSGTDANSTATASVNIFNATVSVIRAETTFAVQTASNDFPTFAEGEKVEKVRVAAAFGGPSSVFLITESGREIPWQ